MSLGATIGAVLMVKSEYDDIKNRVMSFSERALRMMFCSAFGGFVGYIGGGLWAAAWPLSVTPLLAGVAGLALMYVRVDVKETQN